MDKGINNNGYDYVDLGLPSGTLWATQNVGASKPSDAGLYFQWGDTQGYTAAQVGNGDGKKEFASDWSDYKFVVSPNFTKYKVAGATLELEDDAAHVNMGGDWHMPTPEQISELLNTAYTKNEWTTKDGINGRLFTSKTNPSKSIFIPAAGVAWDGSVQGSGAYGVVWSSVLSTDNAGYGQRLGFDSDYANLYFSVRDGGLSVRGVIDKKSNNSKKKKSNMNENLNLVEILKDAPQGTKLWSPIIGECELVEVNENRIFPIKCKALDNNFWKFHSDGRFAIYEGAKCVLFPSKENKDWATFNVPSHKHFEPFQKILFVILNEHNEKVWASSFYSYYDKSRKRHYLVGGIARNDDEVLPFYGNENKLGKYIQSENN